MIGKRLQWVAVVGLLVFVASGPGQGEGPKRLHISGVLDDHTLAIFGSQPIAGVVRRWR